MIALVDCNNFFVSCERVFQPQLEGRPVVVLSNNDGCAISRSNEAKKLVRMGQPYFEFQDLCGRHGISVLSSNYALYNDFSARVVFILKTLAVRQEVYSIDESFLDLTGIPNLAQHGQKIRTTVKQWTGIPVCIGIGPTKVLAKFANFLAKKHKFLNGVCSLPEIGNDRINKAMQITAVQELWGVGRKQARKLNQMGITTVYDLKMSNAKHISKLFSVTMERIVYELNGISCLALDEYQDPAKHLLSSRSFEKTIFDKDVLLAALSYHVEQVSQKLRKHKLYARNMTVFINSDRFKDDYFSNSASITLPGAMDSFRCMTKYLTKALDEVYSPDIGYKKAGIIVTDLINNEQQTHDLFDNVNISHDNLLPTLEMVRRRFGKSSIQLATTKISDKWKMRQNHMSKHYTTNIDQLLEITN